MKQILFMAMSFLCATGVSIAQQKVVTGIVNANGAAIAGASVHEKGVDVNGSLTDGEGRFKLTLKGKSNTLVISYVGFLTQEVTAKSGGMVVSLATDTKGLEDVMVVGYGTRKKITNVGAISSIGGDEIRQTPSASLQNTLMGRVPGFVSQQRTGKPGADGAAYLIRGLNTPNGSNPLIIVDDIEYNGPMSEIDPDQIETLSILKDASMTAIYGVKGANGVILISTRRGKNGQAVVTAKSELALQVPVYMPEYVDAYDAATLVNRAVNLDKAYQTKYGGPSPTKQAYTDEDLAAWKDHSDPYGHPDVNWTKMLIRPNTMQTRNNISVQGGADRLKYFVSAGYIWQNGLLQHFDDPASGDVNNNYYYKRYNFRSNLDFKASKTLDLRLDLSGAFSETNTPNVQGRDGKNNIFFELSDFNQLPPFAYPVRNPDGSYGASSTLALNNVVGRMALGGYTRAFANDMTANLRATQKLDFITQGLSMWANLAYNGRFTFNRNLIRPGAIAFPTFVYDSKTNTYTPKTANVYRPDKYQMNYDPDEGNSFKKPSYQLAINYDRTFSGGNHVYALALGNQNTELKGTNIPVNTMGFTGRVGYDYNKRYLFEASVGYNGTSRFPQGQRYGTFPSVSAGWNIAEESFFKNNVRVIDQLKLRGSFGYVGSDDISNIAGSNYVFIQNYNRSTSSYSIGEVNKTINFITEGTLGNSVTWEKQREWNIGIDIRAFDGRLTVTADLFDKYRYNILQPRGTVSSIIGVALPAANLWIVDNKGFEISATYKGGRTLNYSVSGNISVANNKALNRDEPTQAQPWLALTGKPLGTVLGYTTLGFYTEADMSDPAVAKPASGFVGPGDLKYLDRNKNGVIDPDDRITQQYPNLPNTILGFTGGLNYKGFSLTFTLQSALNFRLRGVSETVNPFQNNFRPIHMGSWTPENSENPAFPRITTVASTSHPLNYPSDYWFIRGDYLRLKTAELGYALPNKMVNRIGLKNVRVYANAYNILTFYLKNKNIYNIDPENASGTDGTDFYPQQKTYNFGVQFSF